MELRIEYSEILTTIWSSKALNEKLSLSKANILLMVVQCSDHDLKRTKTL